MLVRQQSWQKSIVLLNKNTAKEEAWQFTATPRWLIAFSLFLLSFFVILYVFFLSAIFFIVVTG